MKTIISIVRQESPILFWIACLHFVFAFMCIGGLLFDERTLMGINVWIKPLKFALSIGSYILTLGYLITLYPYSAIKKHIIRNATSITLLFEMAIIGFQAARGVQSHYNTSTYFDGILFQSMGFLIAVNVLIMILFIIDTLRLKLTTSRGMRYAILMGWTIMLFGSWAGGQMIAQMGHTVGMADGGEGLPLINWSTVAGDLRAAHFFGLHAIQIIPLFALGLKRLSALPSKWYVTSVLTFGLGYGSWIGFIFYQAKNGIPFIG